MASWDAGGIQMSRSSSDSLLSLDRDYDDYHCPTARKRRLSQHQCFVIQDDCDMTLGWKRPRLAHYDIRFDDRHDASHFVPAFFIIKEAQRSLPCGTLGSYGIDHPICHEFNCRSSPCIKIGRPTDIKNHFHDEAAEHVENDLADKRRRKRLSQLERILRSLICPKHVGADFDIDDSALQSIFYAANEIFFHGKLKGRVTWEWKELDRNLIGTTALRQSPKDGHWETCIYLSKDILQDKKYNRRLLISTFIHELIHSYLFVHCGFRSSECGGHTSGFQTIARLIDRWVGEDLLYLRNMEAELSYFESATGESLSLAPDESISGCQVQRLNDGTPGYFVILERSTPHLRYGDQDLPDR
ncbi:hypothetical protein F5Y15DRAFT_409741 [Xylariaceae sp. FL0016]|nr:hypothetical protein F5Y15DRAFT_409741 [Xylariaceae sp. FL0016]